jgi:hypothetical protein
LHRELADPENESSLGVYYKLKSQNYVLAYRQIKTNKLRDLVKNLRGESQELTPTPNLRYANTIETGYFVEAINSNLRMLYQRLSI